MIISYVIFFIILLTVYLFIGVQFFHFESRKRFISQNLAIYFYVIYLVVFFIILNIILLISFHNRIKNKTGPPGPVGIKGNIGERGIPGKCHTDCLDSNCKRMLLDAVQNRYNELLKKDKLESISIILEIKDELTGIIIQKKLKNLLLNNMIDNLCDSKQLKKAIQNKIPDDVNEYLKKVVIQWIDLIYNALPITSKDTNDDKTNFFLDPNADNNNQNWIDSNPFDKIEKFDIFNWGAKRIFKPLHIKIDNNPNTVNYLPQGPKPPLKIIYSNNYEKIYDNTKNNSKLKEAIEAKSKYPNNYGSLWKNKSEIKYRNETYYPAGSMILGPVNKYDSTIEKTLEDPDPEYKNKPLSFNYSSKQDKKPELNFKGPKKKTILITGDVVNPKDYKLIWNNKESYERQNVSIWRPECPVGYDSLGDVAHRGYDKPDNNYVKCVPSDCLNENEDKKKTLFTTFDNKKILGYSLNDDLEVPNENNSYNMFRYDDGKPLYKINEACLSNKFKKAKPVEPEFGRIGIGWNGRPLRNSKYSIFNYLVQMPEAIIANKSSNYKYYIIHTQLYNSNVEKDANFKTSAKNLYYILAMSRDNKYERCLATDGKKDMIRTKISNQPESYWIIEPVKGKTGEIRLKSYKTGKYFKSIRREDLRKDLVKDRVFEKQTSSKDDTTVFVNIKSSFGTNYKTALENGKPRKEEKYYLNKDTSLNISKKYKYPKRGINYKTGFKKNSKPRKEEKYYLNNDTSLNISKKNKYSKSGINFITAIENAITPKEVKNYLNKDKSLNIPKKDKYPKGY